MTIIETVLYACLWLSFGIVHSLLASTVAKRKLNALFGEYYRLFYNMLSVVHIAAVLYGGRALVSSAGAPVELFVGLEELFSGVRWAGIVVILVALTQYDLGQFSGLAQIWTGKKQSQCEPLHLTGLHRFIRHPLYLGAYLYLWGGATSHFGLQTAIWGSLYLVIGTWFEERKLVSEFGNAYVDYRNTVPSLLPYRGRAFSGQDH